MTWPEVALIVSILISVVTVLLKFGPQRKQTDTDILHDLQEFKKDMDNKFESFRKQIDDRFDTLNNRIDKILLNKG